MKSNILPELIVKVLVFVSLPCFPKGQLLQFQYPVSERISNIKDESPLETVFKGELDGEIFTFTNGCDETVEGIYMYTERGTTKLGRKEFSVKSGESLETVSLRKKDRLMMKAWLKSDTDHMVVEDRRNVDEHGLVLIKNINYRFCKDSIKEDANSGSSTTSVMLTNGCKQDITVKYKYQQDGEWQKGEVEMKDGDEFNAETHEKSFIKGVAVRGEDKKNIKEATGCRKAKISESFEFCKDKGDCSKPNKPGNSTSIQLTNGCGEGITVNYKYKQDEEWKKKEIKMNDGGKFDADPQDGSGIKGVTVRGENNKIMKEATGCKKAQIGVSDSDFEFCKDKGKCVKPVKPDGPQIMIM